MLGSAVFRDHGRVPTCWQAIIYASFYFQEFQRVFDDVFSNLTFLFNFLIFNIFFLSFFADFVFQYILPLKFHISVGSIPFQNKRINEYHMC